MDCPLCQAPLHEHMSFCTNCGVRVRSPSQERAQPLFSSQAPCLACGHHNPPAAAYCVSCGDELNTQQEPSAEHADTEERRPTEERRLATILHADLCGFTRISEQLSPEQTKTLIDALFEPMTREIVAQGGQVNAYLGDAILAVFGVPVSHGDDPVRAARAALALHKVVAGFSHPLAEAPLEIRIGLDTGPIVVSQSHISTHLALTGAPLANAMDLERAAPNGGILLSAALADQLREGGTLEEYASLDGDSPTFLLRSMTRDEISQADVTLEITGSSMAAGQDRSQAEQAEPSLWLEGGTLSREKEDSSIPSEVREVVQARLDQLSNAERRLVKLAAIVGMRFWSELLDRLGLYGAERALESLVARGVIRVRFPSLVPQMNEFEFTDARIFEVAYHNNLKRIRRFFHEVIAAWLQENIDHDHKLVLLLAHHQAAGGNPVAAARTLIDSSERVSAFYPVDQVIARYETAGRLLGLETSDSPQARALLQRCERALADLGSARTESE